MSRKKKCRKDKKYRPSVGRLHLAVGNQVVFGPLLLFLHNVRHSEVEFNAEGRAIVPSSDRSNCYDAYEFLVLFAFFIKHTAAEIGPQVDTAPMLVLAGLIDQGHDVHDDTLTKCDRLAVDGQLVCTKLTLPQLTRALDQSIIDRDRYIA